MSNWKETVTQSFISRSAICAADILEAWHDDDREQLTRKLTKGIAPDFEPDGNFYECERLELLDGIAAHIRDSIAAGKVQDASVYVPLLRHLANSEGTQFNREYVC